MWGWLAGLLGLVVACTPSLNFAGLVDGPRSAHFTDHVAAKRLANGLRIALLPDARTNLVTVAVRYDVGGADDPTGAPGLAHYVEHVIAGAALRGKDGAALRDTALESNAGTTLDRTYFYTTALDVDLDRELEIAARRLELRCDELDPSVLARERDVVIEEAKQRTAGTWNTDAFEAAIWGVGHPYAHAIGGVGFADVAPERVCDFITAHYGPGSATLVITGHVDGGALARISARFAAIPARPVGKRAAVVVADRAITRAVIPGLAKPTAVLVFPFPGEGVEFDAVAEVLSGLRWNLGKNAPGQARKPLVGAGCVPWSFDGPGLARGTLLVGSDGLFKYAARRDLVRIVAGRDLATIARELVELVRLPSGGLQDDVAIVLCRELSRR